MSPGYSGAVNRAGAVGNGVGMGAAIALFWVVPPLAAILLLVFGLRAAIAGVHRLLRRVEDPMLTRRGG